LAFAVLHAHVDVLSRLGSVEPASALLPDLRQLCAEVGQHEDSIRVSWVHARLDFEGGDFRDALGRYALVADQWQELGHGYKWSLVKLEMALVHIALGETPAVRQLAHEALPTLIALQVAPDVFGIFKLLSDSDAMDAQKVRALLRHLEALPSSRTVEASR
jgi:hypothetical protein